MIRLFELLLENIPPEVYNHQIPNPNYTPGSKFKETISVSYALRQPRTSAVHRAAKNYLRQYMVGGSNQSQKNATSIPSTDISATPREPDIVPPISYEETEEVLKKFKGLYRRGIKIKFGKHSSLEEFLDSDERKKLDESLREYPGDLTLSHIMNLCMGAHDAFVEATGDKPNKMQISFEHDKNKLVMKIKLSTKAGAELEYDFVFNKEDPSKSYLNAENLVLDTPTGGAGRGSGEIIKSMISQCDSVGITSIEFFAASTKGGFKWAQMGGIPHMIVSDITGTHEVSGMYVMHTINNRFDNVLDWVENDTWPYEWQSKWMEKDRRQITNIIRKLKQNGELEDTMELIRSCIDGLNSGDPQFLSIMANTPLGRFLLKGTSWRGYFDITPGSESREIIETHA